jgi:glycosyltransferase involved in cell wall biosynthesis
MVVSLNNSSIILLKSIAYAQKTRQLTFIIKNKIVSYFFNKFPRAHKHKPHGYSVAWIVADHLKTPFRRFEYLYNSLGMRVSQVAQWVNRYAPDCHCEMYRPDQRYDAVVFFKAMGLSEQKEARKIKDYGGKVIFDANVNYYEIWGKFDTFSNQPTIEQQKDAILVTSEADLCVGDSTKLCELARKHNLKVHWIPDNVNMNVFRFVRKHGPVQPVRLVWSGISFKADHLLLLEDVLPKLKNVELIIVSDMPPPVIKKLTPIVKCRYVPYSDRGYARLLSQCDIIISPKQLVNSYEIGHTEYKITLGMAAGLPAVASPQQSYIEAISYKGGGVIASTSAEWFAALDNLIKNHKLREDLGEKARQTVIERYSTPVVAKKYHQVIKKCLAR